MTAAHRRERGTRLCRQLVEQVAEIAPHGIGAWEPTWTIVDPAYAAFMIALTAWEASGSEDVLDPLRDAYRDVLAAWQRAVVAFERSSQGAA